MHRLFHETRRRSLPLVLAAALAAGALFPACSNDAVEATEQQIRLVQDALALFKMRHRRYPDTSEGLAALVADGALDALPQDGWGRDLVYLNEGGRCRIVSYGADGAPGGDGKDGDISNLTLDGRGR
jgi:general secretion pathway protein G